MKQLPSLTQLLLAAVLIVVLSLVGRPAVSAQTVLPAAPVCDSSRSVQVTGSALINVTPDRAMIQLGVQSSGVTPDEVQRSNSIAIQKVLRALRDQGIADKDIATDVYVIEPLYEDYNSLFIKGYRINNLVAVTLREVDKTSAVIAAALKAGANQVVNVEFYTSELRKYRDQARELAVNAAKEKAQALADAAGAKAGCVLTIAENSWSYYNGWWYGGSQNAWTQNVVQNAAPNQGVSAGGPNDEPVSLGQISVKAEVSATFSLE